MIKPGFIFCSLLFSGPALAPGQDPADGGFAIRKGRAGRGTGDLALVNRRDDQNLLGKTRPG